VINAVGQAVDVMVRFFLVSDRQADRPGHGARRTVLRQRRPVRRELPPLDLRTPSGKKVLPY
jgi:hypothetical protein